MSKMTTYGRIANDLEVKKLNNQQQTLILNFSVAEKKVGQNETQFVNFVAFGKSAEVIAKYFKKGSRIVLYSHPDVSKYTDKNGNQVVATKFVVEGFEFVDTASERNDAPSPIPTQNPQPVAPSPITPPTDFMSIPDGVNDPYLPFN